MFQRFKLNHGTLKGFLTILKKSFNLILFDRIATICLYLFRSIIFKCFLYSVIGSGLGIYNSSFHVTSVTQLLETFIILLVSIIKISSTFYVVILLLFIYILISKFYNVSNILNKNKGYSYSVQIFNAYYLKFITGLSSTFAILLVKCFYILPFEQFTLISLSFVLILNVICTEYFIKLAFNVYNFIFSSDDTFIKNSKC